MIKWFKRLILLLVLLLALVLGITFTAENANSVAPVLFGYFLPTLSLGLWLLVFLFVGALCGLILSFIPWLWGQKSLASQSRKIKQLEQELTKLRSLGIKD